MLNTFKNYLLTNNIAIQNEDETTISFKKDDLYYLFIIYKDDPFYFRIILPNILQVTDDNKDKIKQLVNDINLKFKVAKAFIVDDKNVWISVEQFVYTIDKIDDLFNRIFILYTSILEEIKGKIKDL